MRRCSLFALCLLSFALGLPHALAMDEIMLTNGARISGKILAQSNDRVVMHVGEGNAVYSKRAIWRIYEDITDKPPLTRVLGRDELPPWWMPLSDLYHEDWVTKLRAIPATNIDKGILERVPYLSFRANMIYEMNIYGNPEDPAGLEIGYYGNMWLHSGDAQRRCREFLASYLGGIKQFEALYRLNSSGGQEVVDGLRIVIIPRGAPDSYNGWWVSITNPAKLDAARCATQAEFRQVCDRNMELVKKSTDGETSWTKYSLQDALKRYLPLPRMEER
jgi:hypothetical protein